MVNKTQKNRQVLFEYAQQSLVAHWYSAAQFSSHKTELRDIFRFLFLRGFTNISLFVVFGVGERKEWSPAKPRSYTVWYLCLILGQKIIISIIKQKPWWIEQIFCDNFVANSLGFLKKGFECVSSRLQECVQNYGGVFWVHTLNISIWTLKSYNYFRNITSCLEDTAIKLYVPTL